MTDDAEDWLRSLPPTITVTIPLRITEFRKRFSVTEMDRWKKVSPLSTREQAPEETVDKYITDLRNTARIVPMSEEMLYIMLVEGLRPDIRLLVLQSKSTNLEDVIEAARITETAIAVSKLSSDIVQSPQQAATLINGREKKPLIAAVEQQEIPHQTTILSTRREPSTPRHL